VCSFVREARLSYNFHKFIALVKQNKTAHKFDRVAVGAESDDEGVQLRSA
jgi:hypothetical protein